MKGLERSLGLPHVVAISIGAMLGSGVFVLPGLAATKTGHSVWLAYLLAGLCVLPTALSKSEMATAMPTSGGTYVYLDRTFGPLAGTVTGLGLWSSLLLKSSFALIGFGAYLTALGDPLPLLPTALLLLVAIVILNLAGARWVGRAMLYVVVIAVVGLGALAIVGFGAVEAAPPGRFFGGGIGGFFGATAFVFVSYAGVTKIAAIAEEVKDPDRNLPLGMLVSLCVVGLLYTLITFLLVDLIPLEELAGDLSPVRTLGARIFGPRVGGVAFALLGVLTMASMANAGLLASSRFPFAMARDQLAPKAIAFVDRRLGTPVVAIVATGLVMAAALVFLDIGSIVKLASAFQLIVFALVNLAVIVLRESAAQWYRPSYRSPLYPAVQVFGIVSNVGLLFFMGALAPLALLGVGIGGGALYFSYGRRRASRRGVVGQMRRRDDLDVGTAPEPVRPAHGPSGEAAVTVPLLGWERSAEALVEIAVALADGRRVEVLHVSVANEYTPVDMSREEDTGVQALRRRVRAMAEQEELNLQFDAVVSRDAVKTAHEISRRLHCEWIVMAWPSRRRSHRFLFLSPLGWLEGHLSSNLAVFRDAGVRYVRRILVHARPGPDDALVVQTADHLARVYGADLTFVRYVPPGSEDALEERRRAYLDELRAICSVPTTTLIVRGSDRVRAIADATAAFDLLVTSAPPAGNLFERIRGWDKDRIVEAAECSVITLRTPPGRAHQSAFRAGSTDGVGAVQTLDLLEYLHPACTGARLPVARKDALLGHLAGRFARALPDLSRGELREALYERERTQNTSLGRGVALPHATVGAARGLVVGVATLVRPIDYDAPDGEEVDVVFSAIAPAGERQTYLLVISQIARLVLRTDLVERLRAARTEEDLRAAVAGAQAASDPG